MEDWKYNPEEFQCENCGKKCNNQHNYQNHKQFHKYYIDKASQEFCESCQREIPQRLYQRHLESVHSVPKSAFNILKEGIFLTGKSLSEAFILTSTKPTIACFICFTQKFL